MKTDSIPAKGIAKRKRRQVLTGYAACGRNDKPWVHLIGPGAAQGQFYIFETPAQARKSHGTDPIHQVKIYVEVEPEDMTKKGQVSDVFTQVAAEGARKALLDKAALSLWNAQKELERANMDGFKDFQKCVDKAKAAIANAETAYQRSSTIEVQT